VRKEAVVERSPLSLAGTLKAKEFPEGAEWFNVARPLRMADLLGKVVLLDFWTYGCINCMHVIPDLQRLEAKYPDELVVVGVHSAKFRHEGENASVGRIVERYELEHPVVNDPGFVLWRGYGVRAWPTLVAIDPAGFVVGKFSGEGVFEPFDRLVGGLVAEFGARPGGLDRRPLDLGRAAGVPRPAETGLAFPGKVLADMAGRRLFVADSNHHRIVIVDLAGGAVRAVVGGPASGFADGSYEAARFARPQGMALGADGDVLYVADSENHAVRAVELEHGRVSTVAGTGRQAQTYPPEAGFAWQTELNSPWDVQLVGRWLFIAMAGSHQLWLFDLASGRVVPWAGSGREGVDDGPLEAATLAQPSGLTSDGEWLYFVDPEGSAVRMASLDPRGGVATIVGTGLFEFGDADGVGPEARLQHPLGLAHRAADKLLYVADTYNSKIKTVDPVTRRVVTLAGGEAGYRDGAEPLFDEPGGVDLAGDRVFVADTNNHVVRVVDIGSGAATTLALTDAAGVLAAAADRPSEVVDLEPQRLAAGDVSLVVDVRLPAGSRLDEQSTFVVQVVDGPLTFPGGRVTRRAVAPRFPLVLPAVVGPGPATVRVDVTLSVCDEQSGGLCRSRQVRLVAPIEAGSGSERELQLVCR
jgi:thiol-disulfide isomerase/thioredoxin